MIYLDNSATTRQYDEVTELMYKAAKDNFGNPSSLHALGFEAGNLLYDARRQIEDLLPPAGNVVFTSGGTESDNMALLSAARKLRRRGRKIITTKVEHPAVLETCKRLKEDGFEVVFLDVDVDGYVEEQVLKAALDENTIIVSIMSVNNEVGTIEPVIPVSRTIRDYNRQHGTDIIFHTDAVQAFGKLPFDDIDADIITASAHKFHGPKGMGFIYMKKRHNLPPYIIGGGQEGGFRSSTENTPGIAGMGLAAEMALNGAGFFIGRGGGGNDVVQILVHLGLQVGRKSGVAGQRVLIVFVRTGGGGADQRTQSAVAALQQRRKDGIAVAALQIAGDEQLARFIEIGHHVALSAETAQI